MNDEPVRASALTLIRTDALWEKTIHLIPTGAQTFSKAPFQHVAGVSPKLLVRGKGSRVWDADGNEFIDYMLGLGPVILGHADDEVSSAVSEALVTGTSMSLPHPMEAELAKELCEIIPCAEMVRFGKNGSDVTAGAVRAARGLTGREKVACCGYHGWQDWFIGSTWRHLGVPDAVRALTLKFEYNRIETLQQLFRDNPGQIACVILEPVSFHEPRDNFLEQVRDLAHANGALLIFDEIITGFRMELGGAQAHYGVVPDLACFGKAMGNGMPISAVVGKAEYMRVFDDIFFSFTFGGELGSIAGALATIRAMRSRDSIGRIRAVGSAIKQGFAGIVARHDAEEVVTMIGFDFWPEYVFKDCGDFKAIEIQSLFQQELVRRGVLTRAGMFISAAHTEEDVGRTLAAMDSALAVAAAAVRQGKVLEWLDGEVIQPVIRPPVLD